MGSLVGESLDLKTIGFRGRKKRVGLTGRRAGSVALTALLSPTGSEGNLGAKSDSSKSGELHVEGGWVLFPAGTKTKTRRQRLVLDLMNAQRPLVKSKI